MALYVFVAAQDASVIDDLQLSGGILALIYVGGGALSGLVGGLLWPYQRTKLETLTFAIPTALPIYLLAGFAMGLSLWIAVWAALASGTLYAMLYGGEQTSAGSVSGDDRDA